MVTPKNILVPVDFGPASEVALDYGASLARTFHATLHVLHAVVDVVPISPVPSVYGGEPAGVFVHLEGDAHTRLRTLLADAPAFPTKTIDAVVRSVSPANAIVTYANDHAIDFIVMGTHGRGAVAHFLLGSVTESVVRAAPCPVLTVRQPAPDAQVARKAAKRPARRRELRAVKPRKRTVA
jgi:nucleotide-binding universal stress UspA family protein